MIKITLIMNDVFFLVFVCRFANCHTFNGGKDGIAIQRTTLGGNENGLRLNLNLEQEHHVREYTQPTAGFKVLVHDQNEYPFVEQFGFVVQPGIHTYCSLRRKKVSAWFK